MRGASDIAAAKQRDSQIVMAFPGIRSDADSGFKGLNGAGELMMTGKKCAESVICGRSGMRCDGMFQVFRSLACGLLLSCQRKRKQIYCCNCRPKNQCHDEFNLQMTTLTNSLIAMRCGPARERASRSWTSSEETLRDSAQALSARAHIASIESAARPLFSA